MKAIIIEDEKPAAQKLLKALGKCKEGVEVVAVLGSVKESTQWLKENSMPELIFMDIDLSDGTAFTLLEQVSIACPVIFTTAYDEYWQEAFEQNGIDYLLKPIKQDKLELALKKYEKLKQYFSGNLKALLETRVGAPAGGYKKRFLIKRGADYVSVKTDDIAYFYAAHKLVCLVDNRGHKFILDDSLADIEKQLDPAQFYRINRKYILQLSAIQKIKSYPKSKLQLEISPAIDEDIIISQENVSAFKEWMGK